MRYRDILAEDRTPALLAKYQELMTKRFGDEASQEIKRALAADPTPQKRYSDWLCRGVATGRILPEDLYKATQYLAIFDKAKGRLPAAGRDINSYRDEKELFTAVEPFMQGEKVSANAEERALARRMQEPENSTVLLDTPEIKIVIPHTEEASCYFGRNTQWCTAATGSYNYFQSYNKKGPLYIVLLKKENKRFQLQPASGQFMDERDSSIRIKEFLRLHPDVAEAIGKPKFYRWCFSLWVNEIDPKEVLAIIRSNPEVIRGLEPKQMTMPRKRAVVKSLSWFRDDVIDICDCIPKPWPKELSDIYWPRYVASFSALVSDVPEEYRTPAILEKIFEKNPQDIARHPDLITPEIAIAVLKKVPRALRYIPKEFRTLRVLGPAGAEYWTSSLHVTKLYQLVDPSQWPYPWVIDMIRHGDIKSFDELPSKYRDLDSYLYGREHVMDALVEAYGPQAVPKKYWSRHMEQMTNHIRPEIRERWLTPKGTKERRDPDDIKSYTTAYNTRRVTSNGSTPWSEQTSDSTRYNPTHNEDAQRRAEAQRLR